MVTTADYLDLAYTWDLTQAGVAYASRSLAHTYDRMGGSTFNRLRRIVAGVAVELAFRRYLTDQEVPFDVQGATPFTDPDRYDLALGGRRCDLKTFLIYNKDRIRQVRDNPEILLEAPALVPSDQIASDHLRSEDIYIFGFQTALITPTHTELDRALAAGQPHFILHPMSERWSRPPAWGTLSPLVFKADTSEPMSLSLGGQDSTRAFHSLDLQLDPRERVQVWDDYHALYYLQVETLPDGLVGVHSPALEETYLIEPESWGNIWVYGLEITLVGYLTSGEFRRKARRVPPGSQVFQYPKTRVENVAVPIKELRPISDVINRVKHWSQR